MNSKPIQAALRNAGCEIHTSRLAQQLYATDASIHQLAPEAVAFPKSAQETAAAMCAAAEAGLAVTPRGAGSGLYGGALGDGLIIDLARHNRRISELNLEARTVRAEAGVVLDQLNTALAPHGLTFGPDVATSSRATIGGMIANNSSGARAPIYGVTIDHVESLELVLADGRIVEAGGDHAALRESLERLNPLIRQHREEIETRFHRGICKRWPGYAVDRFLWNDSPGLAPLLGGSEGTLATVFSAKLRLVPLPASKGLALLFFDSLDAAMQASVDLLDLVPAAIEHIDNVLFDQTRGQRAFEAARALLELDAKPCASILLVEFYEDEADKLAALERKNLGQRYYRCKNAGEMALVWNLRKAGLSLLTGCKGPAKPTTGIEDIAVPPRVLPEYVKALRELMVPLGMTASFYGHAASGLLHVRPVVDLHRAEEVVKFRKLVEGASAITRQFNGSFAAEHGLGMGHTEFVKEHIGENLFELMRAIKKEFDPDNRMNPGKILDDGRFKLDTHLRMGAGYRLELPLEPALDFAAKDGSFVGNLEQCNGCGGCRKAAPTMCPTFIASSDELLVTRGRANIIRAVLDGRLGEVRDALGAEELDLALSGCLSCRACASECPSNVDMALLKAEMLHARHRIHGVPLSARVLSRIDRLGALASLAPALVNASFGWRWLRVLLQRLLGISARRPLPEYASQRFDTWFHKRRPKAGARGAVLLWDDCFVRHNEPHIGKAAVRVLEAAGYEVRLLQDRECCGRAAFSMGRLDVARRMGAHNLALLKGSTEPILFLEPSCYTMFKQDYRELKLAGAETVARRAFLFEEFVETVPDGAFFAASQQRAAIHAHCHAKAAGTPQSAVRLIQRIPGNSAQLLDTGCCGMAGAFGALESKYDLSVQVAADLVEKVRALPEDTALIASGTSCRHQIRHLAGRDTLHIAEYLAQALPTET